MEKSLNKKWKKRFFNGVEITEEMYKKKYNTYICLYQNTIEGNMKLAIIIEWFCKTHSEPFVDNYIKNLDGEQNFNGANNELLVTRDIEQYNYHINMYKNAIHNVVQLDIRDTPIKEIWDKYGTQEEMPNIVQLMIKKRAFHI